MTTNANTYVYPVGDHSHIQGEYGLTKREYFAALAMQGLFASAEYPSASSIQIAEMAVRQADALLKRLEHL